MFPCSNSNKFILWKLYRDQDATTSFEEIKINKLCVGNESEEEETVKVCTGDNISTEFSGWCNDHKDALQIDIREPGMLARFWNEMELGESRFGEGEAVECTPKNYIHTAKSFQIKFPYRVCCYGSSSLNFPLAFFYALGRISPYDGGELNSNDFAKWGRDCNMNNEGINNKEGSFNIDQCYKYMLEHKMAWNSCSQMTFSIIESSSSLNGCTLSDKIKDVIQKAEACDANNATFQQLALDKLNDLIYLIEELNKLIANNNDNDNDNTNVVSMKIWKCGAKHHESKLDTLIPFFQTAKLAPIWIAYCNGPDYEKFKELIAAIYDEYLVKVPIIPTFGNMIERDNLTPQYHHTEDGADADASEIFFVCIYPLVLRTVTEMFYGTLWTHILEPKKPSQEEIEAHILHYAPTAGESRKAFNYQNEGDNLHAATIFIIELILASFVHSLGTELIGAFSNRTDGDDATHTGSFYVHTFGKLLCIEVWYLYTTFRLHIDLTLL